MEAAPPSPLGLNQGTTGPWSLPRAGDGRARPGDRSVIVPLRQALDLAERFPADRCGVIVDAYHVWWDPEVEEQVARAGERILGYHVSDWLVPTPDLLLGRGLMGDGVIDLRRLR